MELKQLVPDPYFLDYLFQSDEFYDENGTLDYDGLLKKCFDDYVPNVIAL